MPKHDFKFLASVKSKSSVMFSKLLLCSSQFSLAKAIFDKTDDPVTALNNESQFSKSFYLLISFNQGPYVKLSNLYIVFHWKILVAFLKCHFIQISCFKIHNQDVFYWNIMQVYTYYTICYLVSVRPKIRAFVPRRKNHATQ